MAMALSFQAMIGLVVGVACISVLTNCTDDVIVIDDVEVADPTARSSEFCSFNSYQICSPPIFLHSYSNPICYIQLSVNLHHEIMFSKIFFYKSQEIP